MAVTGYEGEHILVSNRLHDWEKPETDFNKLDEPLRLNGVMKIGKLGDATARLIHAASMLDFTFHCSEEILLSCWCECVKEFHFCGRKFP